MVTVAVAALAAGWWLGAWQRGTPDGSERTLDAQVDKLLPLVQRGEASAAEQQRLLELLVALNRKAEATRLLEALADRHPERWSLRLLLAQLRREQDDRSGAERELRQLLALQPDRVEALQLLALLQLETGRGAQALSRVKNAYNRSTKPSLEPRALGLGLLLANLQQRQGSAAQAESTLMRLAADFPEDPRPLLARALLQQEQGNLVGAQTSLAQARELTQGSMGEQIDRLATAWGLESLNKQALRKRGASDGKPQRPRESASATPASGSPPGAGNP